MCLLIGRIVCVAGSWDPLRPVRLRGRQAQSPQGAQGQQARGRSLPVHKVQVQCGDAQRPAPPHKVRARGV